MALSHSHIQEMGLLKGMIHKCYQSEYIYIYACIYTYHIGLLIGVTCPKGPPPCLSSSFSELKRKSGRFHSQVIGLRLDIVVWEYDSHTTGVHARIYVCLSKYAPPNANTVNTPARQPPTHALCCHRSRS